jgi:hypothetical protein
VDLSTPLEDRTRALRQEVNYVVARSLHRHSESLVSAFEHVALRVVQEIMKHQYSPTGPTLGCYKGELPFQARPPLPYALAASESHGSPVYVVYKVGGDPVDHQFFSKPPKEIPDGYMLLIYRIAIILYTQYRGQLEEFPERMQTNKHGLCHRAESR